MIYHILFTIHGCCHSVLMKMDYSNPLKPYGEVISFIEEGHDDFQKQSDNFDLTIEELKENNINIINHNIDIELIYIHALEPDNLCIEDITCDHMIKTITLSFTPDMLIEINQHRNNEFLKYIIDKK